MTVDLRACQDKSLKTSSFDYELPPERIAQTPAEPRDASRLLVLTRADGHIEHRHFRDLGDYLHPGDLLVANESRVIPARLFGHKVPTGGQVELLLINKVGERSWEVLLKPGRRVKPGTHIAIHAAQPADAGALNGVTEAELDAEVIAFTDAGGRVVTFSAPIEPYLEHIGIMPLPPYIHTPLADAERYQTVYARIKGSVAAPTAGLHFTAGLIEQLREQQVGFAFVTLHVSMDTFRPVQEEEIEAHHMYSEYCELPSETAAAINRAHSMGKRVIAVGTTSVRTLESAGLYMPHCQARVQPLAGPTNLFIHPGFSFRVVDTLITNFHLPRSSLLMLVAAFAGKELMEHAYQEAIRENYRFYSFGDAMLIL